MLSIMFEKLWQSSDWQRGNITLIFEKGKKRRPGELQASLTSMHGMIMEQILLENMLRHMKNKVICDSQYGFTKEKFGVLLWKDCIIDEYCLNIISLEVCKTFGTVMHDILSLNWRTRFDR